MTKVFLVCSGLGHVRRGYETFMRDCFSALTDMPEVEVWLFKGAGLEGPRDVSLPHLPRAGFGARFVGEITHRGPYVIEQVTLTTSLLPHLLRERPDLVYYCDITIGKLLWQWRRLTRATYRLLLHNGGPHPAPYRWADHVHHLTPDAGDAALAAGHDVTRQTLLPCGLRMGRAPRPSSIEERTARRRELGLPLERPVVLSVGALNRSHKRMDYLISEIASMGPDRPHLVMLGEDEGETNMVRATAELLLGPHGFTMRTVGRESMDRYYRVADVFALASLREAFGLVYAEALGHGLPCVAHDYPVSRFVLGEDGLFADLRVPGNLARQVNRALAMEDTAAQRLRRHASISDRFDWAGLAPRYVEMFQRVARPSAPTPAPPVPEFARDPSTMHAATRERYVAR